MKSKVWYPFYIALLLGLGILMGYAIKGRQQSLLIQGLNTSVFDQIIQLVKSNYVEPVDGKLQEIAIEEFLTQLDPHSVYIPSSDLKGAEEELVGNFEGIGIEFNIFKDTIQVVTPIQGGPSATLGILTGDKIIKINEKNVAGVGITNQDVMKNLKGPKGTIVKVSIKRGNSNKLINFTIKRDKIPLYSIATGLMLEKNTAYIKINSFSSTTYKEFMDKLNPLVKQGATSLIIDLRQNGGGFLEEAVAIADELIDGDKLIVYTEGLHFPRQNYKAKVPGIFEAGKISILIDEGTASASEILAGAIQDWDRGTIVGRRSFGKGLVQDQYKLIDGSALRLTIAKYYTPSGRCIQKPYDSNLENYEHDLMNRYKNGELFGTDSINHNNEKVFTTKIKKRKVYANGGITPDIFVPLDTTSVNPLIIDIYANNLTGQYITQYYLVHKEQLKIYANAKDFNKQFNISPQDYDNFIQYCISNGINKVNLPLKATSYKELNIRLKSLLAKQLWGNDGYYTVILDNDDLVKKVLQ